MIQTLQIPNESKSDSSFGFFEIWIYLIPVVSDFDIRISDFDVLDSLRDKAEPFVLAILEEQI